MDELTHEGLKYLFMIFISHWMEKVIGKPHATIK
jgi:hypothetical protein